MESQKNLKSFSFKLDSSAIRTIVFEKGSVVNQVFVEVIDLSQNSSSVVLDNKFTSSLRKVIAKCSEKVSYCDSVRIIVCLLVPDDTSSTRTCSLLSFLQHL